MLNAVMESIDVKWNNASQERYVSISTANTYRFSGFVTNNTGVPLAAFLRYGRSSTKDKTSLIGLLRGVLPTAYAIRNAGVVGLPVYNGSTFYPPSPSQ